MRFQQSLATDVVAVLFASRNKFRINTTTGWSGQRRRKGTRLDAVDRDAVDLGNMERSIGRLAHARRLRNPIFEQVWATEA